MHVDSQYIYLQAVLDFLSTYHGQEPEKLVVDTLSHTKTYEEDSVESYENHRYGIISLLISAGY